MPDNANAVTVASLILLGLATAPCQAHPGHGDKGHVTPTFEMTAPAALTPDDKRLLLTVVDEATGKFTAARITLLLDGKPYIPQAVNKRGLRFVSIHTRKKQRATMIYCRGAGRVEIRLPDDSKQGVVIATKGYEYLTGRAAFNCAGKSTPVTLRLKQWSTIREEGWLPADEHLHYDRSDPRRDADWLDMLAAEGLTHAHFMVLKGGNLNGVWAKQHAYGKRGQATDGRGLIVPGEEFRGRRQGHINLLGIGAVVGPISIGGLGQPPHPYNAPALHDVFQEARRTGGIGGPAHGGAYAPNSTAAVDTILGAAEFFEISNTHLYNPDVWYRLMNCGFVVPPAAGTDLPNFPFRDDWQPLLGETRMYVRTAKQLDFDSWKRAVRSGSVFISSGPIVRLDISGVQPGGVLQLPAGGGEVAIEAELSCQQRLESFEIVRNSAPMNLAATRRLEEGVHRWKIRDRIKIRNSCWIAARGTGPVKARLLQHTNIRQQALAHTAAIRIIVDNQPIESSRDAAVFIAELGKHQQAYRSEARFRRAADRDRMLKLFESAIKKLEKQTGAR